ncbi:glutamine synthetase [Striga asiatica]|uniref:Glutamine synthetase n=1 Tax=Striga asiatica TaxID=4170 RepID=A0A5A7PVH8_STRAF|nr:glutamine synthetase [Striga asiatica]
MSKTIAIRIPTNRQLIFLVACLAVEQGWSSLRLELHKLGFAIRPDTNNLVFVKRGQNECGPTQYHFQPQPNSSSTLLCRRPEDRWNFPQPIFVKLVGKDEEEEFLLDEDVACYAPVTLYGVPGHRRPFSQFEEHQPLHKDMLKSFPKWNYDGSSTGQAPGEDSEKIDSETTPDELSRIAQKNSSQQGARRGKLNNITNEETKIWNLRSWKLIEASPSESYWGPGKKIQADHTINLLAVTPTCLDEESDGFYDIGIGETGLVLGWISPQKNAAHYFGVTRMKGQEAVQMAIDKLLEMQKQQFEKKRHESSQLTNPHNPNLSLFLSEHDRSITSNPNPLKINPTLPPPRRPMEFSQTQICEAGGFEKSLSCQLRFRIQIDEFLLYENAPVTLYGVPDHRRTFSWFEEHQPLRTPSLLMFFPSGTMMGLAQAKLQEKTMKIGQKNSSRQGARRRKLNITDEENQDMEFEASEGN